MRAKSRWIHGALVVVTLWPLVQLGLSLQYGGSSWKLAGWGMYATPQAQPGLRLYGRIGLQPVAPYAGATPAWLGAELERYRRHRRAFGALHPPDALGRAVLADRPDLEEVVVDVLELHLDRGSALLEQRATRYRYPRR